MARPEALLRLEDLHAGYGHVVALRGLDLVVAPGELVCLIGANGAGKTSTLRAISGLLSPSRGRIVFDGHEIHGAAPADILKAGIAHCPEGRRVFPYLTVEENLAMGAYVRRDRSAIAADECLVRRAFVVPTADAVSRTLVEARHGCAHRGVVVPAVEGVVVCRDRLGGNGFHEAAPDVRGPGPLSDGTTQADR